MRQAGGERLQRLLAATWILFATVCGAAAQVATAQEQEVVPPDRFRRVFVPADTPELWPDDGVRRLPVAREEFAELAASRGLAESHAPPSGARLASSEYRARLEANEQGPTLSGTLRWQLETVGDEPAMARLDPLNLSVDGAEWEGEQRPASFGVWKLRDDASTFYGVPVHKPGVLVGAWRASPALNGAHETTFTLCLPQAVQQSFVIQAPAAYQLSVEPGVAEVEGGGALRSPVRSWRLTLPTAPQYRLRCWTTRRLANNSRLPRASVSESYRFTSRGLDYEAQWRIEDSENFDGQFRLSVSGELSVIAVEVDGRDAPFRRASEDDQTLLVDLPKDDAVRSVRVVAGAPLRLDDVWVLPNARLRDALWIEGAATLEADDRFELQSLTPTDAELLNLVGVGDASGEVYRLQAWNADAAVAVQIAERTPRLAGTLASFVDFSARGEEVTARAVWKLEKSSGAVFHLNAYFDYPWTIDTVDVEPDEAMGDWHVNNETRPGSLHVELRRSPEIDQSVQLTVVGRAPRLMFSRGMTVGQLDWLRARDLDLRRRWLQVRSDQGRFRGGRSLFDAVVGPARLAQAAAAGEWETTQIGDDPADLTLDLNIAPPDASLIPGVVTPSYDASSWTTLTGRTREFDQSIEIQIEPTNGAVDALDVVFPASLPTNARWRSDQRGVVVNATPAVGEDGEGEAVSENRYRLVLSRAVSNPFRIFCHYRETAAEASANAPLFPDAEHDQRWALLRGSSQEYRVREAGAAPVAGPLEHGGTRAALLASLRIDPVAAETPGLVRASEASEAGGATPSLASGALARYMEAHSFYHASGATEHTIRYYLQVDSATSVDVIVPPRWRLVDARVDDSIVVADSPAEDPERANEYDQREPRRQRFSLPSSQAFVTLTLRMQGQGAADAQSGWRRLPLPQTSFPVQGGSWYAWQPPGLAFTQNASSAEFDATTERGELRWSDWPDVAAIDPPAGWRAVRRRFAASPAPLAWSNERHDVAWRWAFALCAWSLVRWGWNRRRAEMIAALAFCAAMSLTSWPLVWSIWTAALVGGGAGAISYRVAGWLATRPSLSVSSTTTADIRSTATLLVVATCACLGAERACAQEPASVYFPVDADGAPSGDDVYAPEPLLRIWERAALRRRVESAEYVLTHVGYELSLSDAQRQEGAPPLQTLVVRVESFASGVELELPLHRFEANWEGAAPRLDGVVVPLLWRDEGQVCVVRLATPGFHELRLRFAPKIVPHGEEINFGCSVPPFPGAVVTLQHDESVLEPTIAAAVQVERTPATQRLRAKLGPVGRLDVAWRSAPPTEVLRLEGEQDALLRIEPALATLRVHLHLAGDAPNLDRVELDVPSDLKLLPLPEDTPVSEVETFARRRTTVLLKLSEQTKLPLDLDVDFQLDRERSTGTFEFPDIHVAGVRAMRRRFAASIGGGLAYQPSMIRGLQEIPGEELRFMRLGPDERAQLAYAVLQDDPQWRLSVHPQTADPRFVEEAVVTCGRRRADAVVRATVEDAGTGAQMAPVELPKHFRLRDCIVRDVDANAVPCRWVQQESGAAQLFLGRPFAKGDQLSLYCDVAYDRSGAFTPPGHVFPAIERRAPTRIEVRRRVDALVRWRGASPEAIDDEPHTPSSVSGVAGVGRYLLTYEEAAAARLAVVRNLPLAVATTGLSVTRDKSDSQSKLHFAAVGTVRSGVIDRLRINAPLEWGPAFRCEPQGRVVAQPHPYESGRQLLTVLLADGIGEGETFQVVVSAALAARSDPAVEFPHAFLEGVKLYAQYVVLPNAWNGNYARWRPERLRSQPLPDRLLQLLPAAVQDGASYVVKGDQFEAKLVALPSLPDEPQIYDQTGTVRIDDDGVWNACLQIVVQPGLSGRVDLELPPGCELRRASVDGEAQRIALGPDGRWHGTVGPPRMPHVIEACYASVRKTPDGPERHASAAPLQAPSVYIGRQSLVGPRPTWCILGPDPDSQLDIVGGRLMSAAEATLQSRQRMQKAEQDAEAFATQLPEWEAARWGDHWAEGPRQEYAEAGAVWSREQEDGGLRLHVVARRSSGKQALSLALAATLAAVLWRSHRKSQGV
ncbi:MAG: hypothetical protein KDA61_00340 [Planctomycetales bacterium]|nr:hypothetical protein [Planctomycetales bacterium]